MSLLVTALAATSALTLAACGSSGTTASGGSKPTGSANSGSIVWSASPIIMTSPDPRRADQRVQESAPEYPRPFAVGTQ